VSEQNSNKTEKKKIIQIDKELCKECAECVIDCLGGPQKIINADSETDIEFFCEGLGGCAKKCPEGAISFK